MSDLSVNEIDEIITNANLDEISNPQTGDCVSVAVAIKNLFGGTYVCGYETPSDVYPVHATVEIDSRLLDGNGFTYREALYDTVISGLKTEEYGPMEEHIHTVETLKNNALYDKKTREKVEKRLRESLENYQSG